MVFQFKIQIKGISKPPVWRRVLVPGHFTFERFHQVIQAAFGWNDYHLFQFSPGGYGTHPNISIPDEFDDHESLDAGKVKVSDIFHSAGQKFTYIYDLGDDWIHQLNLEDILETKTIRASLIAAKGACPPEDCGGPWGYAALLEAVNDPTHPDYKEMREWLGLEKGETWDVNENNLALAKTWVTEV